MRISTPLVVLISSLGITAIALAADDPLMKQAQGLFQPIPLEPPAIKDVTTTPAMVELGKALYFDPRLSQSHNISCNTCHQIGLGGVDMLSTSIGHKWQKGGRNAPTVLNAVFNVAQFWDGRAADLKAQAGGPIQNPIEMGITHEHAIEMLKGIPGYAKPFEAAFPSDKDRITMPNVVTAIAAFEANSHHAECPLRQIPPRRCERALGRAKGGVEAIHRYGLCQLSFRHQCWWSDVCPVRSRRETGR